MIIKSDFCYVLGFYDQSTELCDKCYSHDWNTESCAACCCTGKNEVGSVNTSIELLFCIHCLLCVCLVDVENAVYICSKYQKRYFSCNAHYQNVSMHFYVNICYFFFVLGKQKWIAHLQILEVICFHGPDPRPLFFQFTVYIQTQSETSHQIQTHHTRYPTCCKVEGILSFAK